MRAQPNPIQYLDLSRKWFAADYCYLGSLQQPGESLTRPHLEHFSWPALQQSAVPLIWPHFVQIDADVAPAGILQQPGEPFTRLHLEHSGWSPVQHTALPFIWPQ